MLSVCLHVLYNVCTMCCLRVYYRDMLKYTANVREWMAADDKNIIAIHCKGGKGLS